MDNKNVNDIENKSNNINNSNLSNEVPQDENNQPKPGDKVGTGQVLDEYGEVKDSNTKEALKAALNVGAAIASGGSSAGASAGASAAGASAAGAAAKSGATSAAKAGATNAAKSGATNAAKSGATNAAKSGAGNAAKAGSSNGFNAGKDALKPGGKGFRGGGSNSAKDTLDKVSKYGDKAIGVVADKLDKVPGVSKFTEENKDTFQGINNAFGALGSALNGDLKGAKDSVDALKKNAKNVVKEKIMKALPGIILSLVIAFVIFIAIVGPVLGGYLGITEKIDEIKEAVSNFVTDLTTEDYNDVMRHLVGDTPGYDSLSERRKRLLAACALVIDTPYKTGGRATSNYRSGVPADGLDSGGFIEWTLWNATGSNPGYLTSSQISQEVGITFEIISEDELLPGDYGLTKIDSADLAGTNSVGIYAGNGKWYHMEAEGVVRSSYSGYTVFLRRIGIDDGTTSNASGSSNVNVSDSDKVNKFLSVAQDAIGKIPYYYGGSAKVSGYDGNNFGASITPNSYNSSNGHYLSGLDCSHFIDWVAWTSLGDNLGNGNTSTLWSKGKEINESDLQPGDLGFFGKANTTDNHVGIYYGDGIWIHESSTANNVVKSSTIQFNYFVRLNILS
ncbi:MAG TPA: NlpC/P60 family protein [Bacilli bacterium]|nr:NlpC/P60 family protein [Bacilli bacterium]HQC84029.1 NlpC/P60 family protein [Bacilli bacterium]